MRQPNCNFAPTEECRETWKGSHWTLTSSSSTPMGPVFDVRWEAFKELNNFGRIDEYIPVTQQQKTAVLTFSVRTLADSNVYLCDTKDIKKFCYWVGIGTQDNTVSVIRKCPHGVLPNPPPKSGVCGKIRASLSHKPLSATEWRTFTLFWNHTSGNISLYDTKRLLMTYADTEEREHSQETYHIILRHPRPALYRLHTYQFFRTSNPEGILKSPILFRDISTICFQVLIGLCAKCKMEIVAIDVQKEEISEVLGVADGSRVAAVHGLPMWQRVRIDKAISFDTSNGFGIKFVPRLIGETANPLWAVANFRACYPEGTVRIASMTATQDYANYKYIWRNVTCQKLSYDENTLVNSVQDPRLGTKFVDSECPLDKIGPYCSTSCTSHLEVEANCFGVVICEESGCTCPPGFVGMKCRKKCDIGKYGHDCNGTCGTCYRASCDSRTGHCTNGCDNSKRFNIPPHCKKGIDPPPPPEINFFNETTVIASIPARDEYKEITTEYLFIAKVNESGEIRSGLKNNPILPNTTKLIGRIDGLTPGTVYGIACVLYVGEKHRRIFGEFRNVTKLCAPAIVFDVEVEERGITLKKKEEKQLSYPCPEYWYVVILETVEPNKVVGRKVLEGLPHQFLGLTPDTRYKVTVGRENTTLFARETRTLEDAPSTVRNMTIKFLAHTEISLTWSPPEILNGVIRRYIIILRVITYYGCAALKRTVPEMDVVTTFSSGTTIIFPHLHPYAYYAAIVSACTSKCGPEQTTYFSIEASATPTAVFSNVKFENNVLSWESTMDCRTITGPIFGARILIDGVSESVKTQHLEKVTALDSITLNAKTLVLLGAESYRARVYVIRGYKEEHNDAAYAETVFRVPPMPPPSVRNLEVYEVDVEGGKTSLRWQAPSPPLHGKLESYTVFKCSASCDIVQTIKPDAACELWENYICATVDLPTQRYNGLSVSARNVNVSRPGVFLSVPVLRQEAAPVASKNFTVDVLDKGVVNVSWSHPWKSGGPLKRFLIRVQMLMTNRRDGLVPSQETIIEYPIKRPMRFYNFPLYLTSSSRYKIVLCIVTNRRTCFIEDIKQIDTPPAIAFDGELRFEIREGESTIDLHIPPVLNDTKTSITHVIVKGPQPCEQYAELTRDLKEATQVKDYEVAWRAATFPTDEFAGKVFQVGNNKLYDGVTNCPLKSEKSYTIVVIVQTEGESKHMISQRVDISIRGKDVPQRHDEAWIIPVVILLVVVAAGFFYCYRRKRSIYLY